MALGNVETWSWGRFFHLCEYELRIMQDSYKVKVNVRVLISVFSWCPVAMAWFAAMLDFYGMHSETALDYPVILQVEFGRVRFC